MPRSIAMSSAARSAPVWPPLTMCMMHHALRARSIASHTHSEPLTRVRAHTPEVECVRLVRDVSGVVGAGSRIAHTGYNDVVRDHQVRRHSPAKRTSWKALGSSFTQRVGNVC
jgi:hypothetical protein